MTAVGICLILLFSFCFISAIILSNPTPLVGVILTVITFIYYANEPKAIDVYQGKTELRKTYINNQCVDSCVVFKDID